MAFVCCNAKKSQEQTVLNDGTCKSIRDTTIHLAFSLDTSKTDFFEMIVFIEKKGQFSRFNREHNADSSIDRRIILRKLLCEDKYYDSPIERWVLDSVFSISYFMNSVKPLKTTNLYPGFKLTQINFLTSEEMEIAAKKIKEVRWGDPLHKWNDWYFVKGKRRIYILESYLAAFSEFAQKYQDILQNEWVKKDGS